jgi:hypothetical protein
MSQGTLLYAQSGGVTAVINATAAAVIGEARAARSRSWPRATAFSGPCVKT